MQIINLFNRIKQLIKFGIVGIGNNIIFLSIYYLLLYFKINYQAANISGYLLSSIFGYLINKVWVFNSKASPVNKSLSRYYIVYATAFLINLTCMYIFVEILKIPKALAPYFILIITIPYNFILSKLWVYR